MFGKDTHVVGDNSCAVIGRIIIDKDIYIYIYIYACVIIESYNW